MAFKLPSITSAIPRDLRSFCDRVREALNAQGNDRIITRRDLIATGVVVQGPAGTLLPLPPEITFGTPPAPSGLAASGAIANIILTWDAPNYAGHSYTEIFVANTNTFADRVKLADAPGSVFSHSVGAATTKYYWIQFVNLNEVKGPFNSTIGVSGTTGQDPDYLMDVLSDAFGSTSLAPFFQIDVPTTINGVLIPAGTYIKQAFIADATISRAKIQDLAVDNAKIDNLDAVKITTGFLNAARIQAGSIDANKLNFTVVGTTNVVGTINASVEGIRISGNKIQIDGNVTFSSGYDPTTKVPSGGAATDINNNVTTISGGKITTGSIDANKLNFTVVGTNNVVGTINSSSEGIRISGNRIQIDGNVTFSAGYDPTTKIASGGAATDINNNVTTISGGQITTGSITADKINVTNLIVENLKTSASGQRVEITKTNNDLRIFNSSGTNIAQLGGTGLGASLKATSTTLVGPAVWGVNTGAPGVYGQATTGEAVYGAASSSGYGVFGTSSSSNGGRFTSTTGISLVVPSNGADITGLVSLFRNANDVTQNCTNSNSGASAHAIRAGNTNKGSSGLVGPARSDCDFFAEGIGVYLPFTGAHEGVILKTESFELGDILVDGNILFRKGLSDCASEMFVSTTANQKAVIGVLEKTQEITESIYLAAAITEMETIVTPQERKEFEPEFEPIVTSKPVINPAFYELAPTHHLCTVNAVGEGLINVCGESGNIEAGDLIVTSSLPGKGMKQSDDIVRAVTVAKARESVTFASPTEVKQIACIYLCG